MNELECTGGSELAAGVCASPAGCEAGVERDHGTAEVVASMARLRLGMPLGLAVLACSSALCEAIVAGPSRGLFALALGGLLAAGAGWLLERLVLAPIALLRFSACVRDIRGWFCRAGYTPSLQWAWKRPTPGMIALDSRRQRLFIESAETDYVRLLLAPEQILAAKVERQSTVLLPRTRHGARHAAFVRLGLGYPFGARSASSTRLVEQAFLEVHYTLQQSEVPRSIAIPFQERRRRADSMALALRRMRRASQPPARAGDAGGR